MPTRPLIVLATLSVSLLFAAAPVQAVVVERLYEATVPVADQSAASQQRGLKDALAIVFVRASGRRDAAAIDVEATRLVQQFRFEQQTVTDPETGEPRQQLNLWARFDAVAVQRALVERDVPIWGRERPAVLVWLAYDDGFERDLVDSDAPHGILAALTATARRRGVPIIPPLMDLQDRTSLPFSDLWGGFDDAIAGASQRYRSDAILVGRLFRADTERWGARWILYSDGASSHKSTEPGPLDAVVADGVHWIADGFAEQFSLMPDTAADGRTRIVVAGIDGIPDYASVLGYLRSLSPVAGVAVERVERDQVVFALELRGTAEQLERAIALGSELTRAPDDFEALTGSLRYTLRP
ncbi:MAG: DUF2066 domain-containing protein [Gammaproteobacteria bacterium]